MADDGDDGPPPERSARVRPKQCSSSLSVVHRRAAIDPRFSDLYGTVDQKQYEANYKFLQEQQEEEERQRRHRIRCLKCILRRAELESAGADLEEYDLSENERDVFGEDYRELAVLKLRPPEDVQTELWQLQRESQLYKTRTKGRLIKSRRDVLRKEIIKREATAVKEGKKQRPFIPKRAQLKREILADTFDRLEKKGGKGAVDRYVERKIKRRS